MATPKVSDAQIRAQIPGARARNATDRARGSRATSARYDRRAGRIVLELTNGYLFAFPVGVIAGLRVATPAQRAAVVVSHGGSALRWNALDVDLSVAGLVLSVVGSDDRRRDVARMLGQSRSASKAAASRANGAKGGRPRTAVLAGESVLATGTGGR